MYNDVVARARAGGGHAGRAQAQTHTHTTHARLARLPLLTSGMLRRYASADTRSSNASSVLLSSRNCSSDTVGMVRLRPSE